MSIITWKKRTAGTNMIKLAPIDGADLAQSVREDTAELASYALSRGQNVSGPGMLGRQRDVSNEFAALPAREGGYDSIRSTNERLPVRRSSFSQIALAFKAPDSR